MRCMADKLRSAVADATGSGSAVTADHVDLAADERWL